MSYIKNPKWRPFFALLCACGWALAFPFIKLAYRELGIASADTGSKVLVAGLRFAIAGLIVLLICAATKTSIKIENKSTLHWILLFALVNITLHYCCSFIGLGYILSSRGTILDSMGYFLLIVLSSLVFKEDTFTLKKVIGCLMGLSGIILINVHPGERLFADISFLGDGMILFNSLFSALGGIITRLISKKTNIVMATGYSMAIGGLGLMVIAFFFGLNEPWNISLKGILLLLALATISAVCFYVYNQLLAWHPISKVAIFCAFVSILGVFFSTLFVGDPLKWQYVIAAAIVSVGVYLVNHN